MNITFFSFFLYAVFPDGTKSRQWHAKGATKVYKRRAKIAGKKCFFMQGSLFLN